MMKIAIAALAGAVLVIGLAWMLSSCAAPQILGGPPSGKCGWGVPYGDAGACCPVGYEVMPMTGKCEAAPEPPPGDFAKRHDAGLEAGH